MFNFFALLGKCEGFCLCSVTARSQNETPFHISLIVHTHHKNA